MDDRHDFDTLLVISRDIAQMPTALDAERLLSMVLGSVYAQLPDDRNAGFEEYLVRFRDFLTTAAAEPHAALVGAVLDIVAGPAFADAPAFEVTDGPGWRSALGAVRVTGTYAYGDRYGDQTSYLATFAYHDPDLGGDDHAVVVLADHNRGLASDIFVTEQAGALVAGLRNQAATDELAMTWFSEIDPSTVRTVTEAYVACADEAIDDPLGERFAANRALALARLALLPVREVTPARTTDPRSDLLDEFIESPEADLADLTGATGARRESLAFCLSLIIDFGTSRGDVLRWSPAGVETFLGSWVHSRAVIDADDMDLMPVALRAWIAWAGRRVDLPAAALQETLARVREMRGEFARLCKTGERRSPAVRAMARLVAAGVDLDDTAAVEAWLAANHDSI